MVFVVIIPLTIVAILGISGYLLYRFVIFDFLSNKSVNDTLRKYDIKKTPFEITKEYHETKVRVYLIKRYGAELNNTKRKNQNSFLQCMIQFEKTLNLNNFSNSMVLLVFE